MKIKKCENSHIFYFIKHPKLRILIEIILMKPFLDPVKDT